MSEQALLQSGADDIVAALSAELGDKLDDGWEPDFARRVSLLMARQRNSTSTSAISTQPSLEDLRRGSGNHQLQTEHRLSSDPKALG